MQLMVLVMEGSMVAPMDNPMDQSLLSHFILHPLQRH
jgi:hypothetical protein